MSGKPKDNEYAVSKKSAKARMEAPVLPYQPRDPVTFRPAIGLIACGGITRSHCTAYQKAGYNIVALCDLIKSRATKRRKEFFPDAIVTTDYRQILARPEIEVVDIATHPRERLPLIEAALRAGKHVLSQKPFVIDLDQGERLVRIADEHGVQLAVNQNGRWAPHFSYIQHAVKSGLIGDLISVHTGVHWDHSWTKGTPFEKIHDLVLYDFAIHWFDMLSHLLGDRPIHRVFASRSRAHGQEIRPPLLAQAIVEFEGGQASLVFDAFIRHGAQDRTYVGGTNGALSSIGPDLSTQTVTLTTAEGSVSPRLEGSWFTDGFHGTMGELLCAIEENREPLNSARENLRSLALCFAAIASASDGEAKVPGAVRRLPRGSAPGTEEA